MMINELKNFVDATFQEIYQERIEEFLQRAGFYADRSLPDIVLALLPDNARGHTSELWWNLEDEILAAASSEKEVARAADYHPLLQRIVKGTMVSRSPHMELIERSPVHNTLERREPPLSHKAFPAEVPARISGRKRKCDSSLKQLKSRVRKLRDEGLSHKEICERLGNSPRPPRAVWRDLMWATAYKQRTAAVSKWLSQACSDLS
jgi:hypothetical protein